jgi:hypothetical protein
MAFEMSSLATLSRHQIKIFDGAFELLVVVLPRHIAYSKSLPGPIVGLMSRGIGFDASHEITVLV